MTKEEIKRLIEIAEESIKHPLSTEETIRKHQERGIRDENGKLIPPFDVLLLIQ
ncbi:hypothetical protein ECE50_026835 [Chitinophaga sp. Mgbs1]|uniref:Uncharacterized protein n=1 Tax=Chitinophaga solisilvae TaxID=1233460 RepID=A0A9Q5DAT3_9BACT|nr:hypothetical protein [Chitinophaga solisilvae]